VIILCLHGAFLGWCFDECGLFLAEPLFSLWLYWAFSGLACEMAQNSKSTMDYSHWPMRRPLRNCGIC